MTIFLAVMVTDVVVLDMFNSMGMPTSTTVSLVFELLGASFVMALLKMAGDDGLTLGMLLNSNKALTVIIAIFVSVAIAFVAGLLVQWLARVIFSFNYKKKLGYTIGIFGGIAFTSLAYFILIKGLGDSPFIHEDVQAVDRRQHHDHTGRGIRHYDHTFGNALFPQSQRVQDHSPRRHLRPGDGLRGQRPRELHRRAPRGPGFAEGLPHARRRR